MSETTDLPELPKPVEEPLKTAEPPKPKVFQVPTELVGNGVTLRPFNIERHGRIFYAEVIKDPELWINGSAAAWDEDWDKAMLIFRTLETMPDCQVFAVLDTSTGEEHLAGITALTYVKLRDLDFKTGCALFKRYRRTHVNAVRRYLLLSFAFETLGLRRAEGLVYTYNTTSLMANLRAGYVLEGIKRDAAVVAPSLPDLGTKLTGQLGQPERGNSCDAYQLSLTFRDWEGGVREKLKAAADRAPAKIAME